MASGRKTPYSEIGIKRLKCARCKASARFQWTICSDGNLYRPMCLACDIALNRLVLEWMGDPDVDSKIAAYIAMKNAEVKALNQKHKTRGRAHEVIN